jgi:metal-responsive CopG/Arc/MetJ family transcriptional regulator
MKEMKPGARDIRPQSACSVRASISFPPDLYETLEELAKRKKVSLAWVVRDAAGKYIADQRPLSGKQRGERARMRALTEAGQ